MKIRSIRAYRVDLPYKGVGRFWQHTAAPATMDSTIVAVETDSGVIGFGESCPIGAIYLEAFAETARAAIARIAPALIGQDPRQLQRINETMDATVLGHAHAKSPIDIACWDILGQATGLPLHTLLGGRFDESVPLVVIVPFGSPEEMACAARERRREGFRIFQMKVGSDVADDVARVRAVASEIAPGERLIVDANRGWTSEDALRIVRALDDVDCLIEQPCSTYEACLAVRRRSAHPFILDEIIGNAGDLVRAYGDGLLDGLVIKLSHAGGLTRAMALRDLCASLRLRVRIEDTAGSEFVLAATAHLAHATTPASLIGAYPFSNPGISTASGAPQIRDGRLYVSDRPGLGLVPDLAVLGEPLFEVG